MYPSIHFLGFQIGTYGLMMVLAFLLVGFLAFRRASVYGIGGEDVLIVGASACGMGILCGNFLYILVTYSPEEILEILRLGHLELLFSGIVFYGGLLGGLLGAWIGTRIAKCRLEAAVGTAIIYIPLGHSIGRVGCLLAGCCHGFAYDGLFAVYYPNSVAGLSPQQGYFPAQICEAVCNIGICMILRQMEKKGRRPYTILVTYLGSYACVRFAMEFLRGDVIRGIYAGFSISQWISIVIGGFCAAYFVSNRIRA